MIDSLLREVRKCKLPAVRCAMLGFLSSTLKFLSNLFRMLSYALHFTTTEYHSTLYFLFDIVILSELLILGFKKRIKTKLWA